MNPAYLQYFGDPASILNDAELNKETGQTVLVVLLNRISDQSVYDTTITDFFIIKKIFIYFERLLAVQNGQNIRRLNLSEIANNFLARLCIVPT